MFPYTNITLVGTCHDDPMGPERLRTLLCFLSPDILTVEDSPGLRRLDGANVMRARDILIGMGCEPGLVEKVLAKYGVYEPGVCSDFAKREGIPTYDVDLLVPRTSWLVESESLDEGRRICDSDLIAHLEYECEVGNAYKRWVIDFINETLPTLDEDRDWHMAGEIARLAYLNPEKRIVHVGGASHMYPNSKRLTLGRMLPFAEVRMLDEADSLYR